ncbi:MAG: hypothetical protein ACKVIN_16030, partial [Longimicrobiales bacterium]
RRLQCEPGPSAVPTREPTDRRRRAPRAPRAP